ncbi:MAG: phage N-6-adenine-methyltransferase [Nitrospirota bacterium]|nr:phage N-6-adenine-methyltransferase [Nitrospirota bacterium]
MPREGKGSAKDGKHYWLTPPELLEALTKEFDFTFDACPYPRPEDFDGLTAVWGESTYVNPPFSGPTAWVRKAMAESEKGKRVVLVFPIYKWILMLLTHPNFKEVRNLKDVKWCAIEDGTPGRGIGQHIAMFVLDGEQEDFF